MKNDESLTLNTDNMYPYDEYRGRELLARRAAKDEARKQGARRFVVGAMVGVTLMAAAAEFVKYEYGRMNNQAQATKKAQELITPDVQPVMTSGDITSQHQ